MAEGGRVPLGRSVSNIITDTVATTLSIDVPFEDMVKPQPMPNLMSRGTAKIRSFDRGGAGHCIDIQFDAIHYDEVFDVKFHAVIL